MTIKAKCTGVTLSGNQAMPYLVTLQVEGQSVQIPMEEPLRVGASYTLTIAERAER